jgi:2Fe-2S ferredoxin
MTTVTFVLQDGAIRTVEAKNGMSLMETAVHNNIRGIDAECGGCCSCATCHVYVDDAHFATLPSPDDLEMEMLEGVAAERRPTSRLGCQVVISDAIAGMTVTIPERQT